MVDNAKDDFTSTLNAPPLSPEGTERTRQLKGGEAHGHSASVGEASIHIY